MVLLGVMGCTFYMETRHPNLIKIGKKIREAELQKYPFMLIIGEDEENNATVSVRKQGESGKSNTSMKVEDFISKH